MAQDRSPEGGVVSPSTEPVPSPVSQPVEARREVRFARYLVLLAFPFVALLFYDLALLAGFGLVGYWVEGIDPPLDLSNVIRVLGPGIVVLAWGGFYMILIYAFVYRRLTRNELSGALGAALVLGLLTLFQGLIALISGLSLGSAGLPSEGEVLLRVLLVLGVVAGILLLAAYTMGAKAERRLQGAASPARA
ncbi:MAG: hypothetical protein ACE5EW_07840 [Thermoplasmata archaeon]